MKSNSNKYGTPVYTSARYLSEEPQLYPIPSNIILNKVVAGWGATTAEIQFPRHSIIILPHKSQIYSKHNRHNEKDNTFPVTEDQKTQHIKAFIRASEDRFTKFLCTPEGLKKLILAILQTGRNPFVDYFLLLDESHKVTKDSGYRVNISSVMEDFFSFTNKAMISATPFMPSDPRFQDFELRRVEHRDFKKQELTLLTVNSLASGFKDYIENYTGEMLFVFFNSLKGIHSLIKKNQLEERCNIYCSVDGKKDFEEKGMKLAYDKLEDREFKQINFLSSSFFNGIDIDNLGCLPDILILTDTNYVSHSIIDPYTETHQILGRIRNPDPLNKMPLYRTATHLVNTRYPTDAKEEYMVIDDFKTSQSNFEVLRGLRASAPTEFLKDVYAQAMQRIKPYANLIDRNGDFDYFKYDNYLYEERVKMFYAGAEHLQVAYIKTGLFNITHSSRWYLPDDLEKMSNEMKRYSKQNVQRLTMEFLELQTFGYNATDTERIADLIQRFPLVKRAIDLLGFDRIDELEYSASRIRKALLKLDIAEGRNYNGIIDAVYRAFAVGKSYTVANTKSKLQSLFADYEITANVKSTDINTYFKVKPFMGHENLPVQSKTRGKNKLPRTKASEVVFKSRTVRMYKLVERMFNVDKRNSTRELHNLNNTSLSITPNTMKGAAG